MKRYDIDTHYCEHDGSSWGIAVSSPTGEYVRFDDLPPEPQWMDKPDHEGWWWMLDEDGDYGVFYVFQIRSKWVTDIIGVTTDIPSGRWARCIKPSPPS